MILQIGRAASVWSVARLTVSAGGKSGFGSVFGGQGWPVIGGREPNVRPARELPILARRLLRLQGNVEGSGQLLFEAVSYARRRGVSGERDGRRPNEILPNRPNFTMAAGRR